MAETEEVVVASRGVTTAPPAPDVWLPRYPTWFKLITVGWDHLGGLILSMPKLLQIAWSLSNAPLFLWIKTESSKDRTLLSFFCTLCYSPLHIFIFVCLHLVVLWNSFFFFFLSFFLSLSQSVYISKLSFHWLICTKEIKKYEQYWTTCPSFILSFFLGLFLVLFYLLLLWQSWESSW